ncbi:WD repeat-containing protein 38 isoform X1 [Phascolarctos cinereus]|uniref:WD repeat-containing protein 38 isoform X1 n=2 Tax=Phascolarctos cinereus TaxID=38626 RepID=A0A6P5IX63_PHACI|nr:WD repeat-containing protein 38 isoform X1 [Phascolarctos cinereus]
MPRSTVTMRELPGLWGKAGDQSPRDRSPDKATSETTSTSSTQTPQTPPSPTGKAWAPLTVGSIKYFSRHKGEVNSCAFSPDTRILLTCCDDNKVYMWGARTGNLLRKLKGHKGPVLFCRFSPNGRFFASASRDCTVRLWDVQTTECLQVLRDRAGDQCWELIVSVLHTLACAGVFQVTPGVWRQSASVQTPNSWHLEAGTARLYSGKYRRAKPSLNSLDIGMPSKAVTFLPIQNILQATGSWDSTVQVWDLHTLDKIKKKTLEGHKGNVSCVCFSPSGLLASGSWDKTILIWKPETGKLLIKLLGHLTWVKSMAFSADGLRMASSEYSEMVKIWDCTTGTCTESLRGVLEVAHVCAFTPDGKLLVSGSADHRIFGEGIADGQVFGEYSRRCQMSHSASQKSTLSDSCFKATEIRNLNLEPGATIKRAKSSTISTTG